MKLPRRLFRTADGQFCEEDDLRQAWVFGPAGKEIPDAEADRIGLTAYLAHESQDTEAQPEHKMVQQSEVEDKSVHPPTTDKTSPASSTEDEPKRPVVPAAGIIAPPDVRRRGPST